MRAFRERFTDHRGFIGGSDARIIMGPDEDALIRLWREKRGEVEPRDFTDNLIVQVGIATKPLNRAWYERNTGKKVRYGPGLARHPVVRWMAAKLDGVVDGANAVFEAKFMLPWAFSEASALEKYMAQLQHNMWVAQVKSSVLSIITGGGQWLEIVVPADALYQHLLITAEKRFWRCVATGERPSAFGLPPPRPAAKAARIVDMTKSNSWAEFAELFRSTRPAFLEHRRAEAALTSLMPADAGQAIGHGVKGERSKEGAVSFVLLGREDNHAAV
jgi:predicted phage-related endonuclease